MSPLIRLISVVFPAPFEPMRASTSPADREVDVVHRVGVPEGLA